MNKRQLAAAVAPGLQLPAAQVEKVIQAAMDHLAGELARAGRPELDRHGVVFGQLVAGWEVLDRLLASDDVLEVAIRQAEVPAAGAYPQ